MQNLYYENNYDRKKEETVIFGKYIYIIYVILHKNQEKNHKCGLVQKKNIILFKF